MTISIISAYRNLTISTISGFRNCSVNLFDFWIGYGIISGIGIGIGIGLGIGIGCSIGISIGIGNCIGIGIGIGIRIGIGIGLPIIYMNCQQDFLKKCLAGTNKCHTQTRFQHYGNVGHPSIFLPSQKNFVTRIYKIV